MIYINFELLGWILTATSLTGTALNSQMKASGFIFWIIGNAGWCTVNILGKRYSQAGLFFVNTLFCIRGLYVWGKKNKRSEENESKLEKEINK